MTETLRRMVLMGLSWVERLTNRRVKEACKRGRFLSSFLFFLQITITTILSRDLVSLHKRLIVVRASCLQYRFVYSFSKPCSQIALETLRGPKTMSFLRGSASTQPSLSSKWVISHNNTAHPLLGQNKTKQNKTKQTKKVKHNISTPSYKKPIFGGLCPWNPHSLVYTLHFQEISVKIINSTHVSKKWAVWRQKLTFYVNLLTGPENRVRCLHWRVSVLPNQQLTMHVNVPLSLPI